MIPRLLEQEIAYTALRAAIIGRHDANPFGAATRRFGPAFACRVKGVPSPWLNRAMALTEASAADIPAIAAWFAEAEIAPRWETTPDSAGPALARALAATGALPAGGDTLVLGAGRGGAMPPAIAVVAGADAMDDFLDTHLAGLEIPPHIHPGAKHNMRGWLGQPGLVMLLAFEGQAPAASCVLHRDGAQTYVADMATRPEHRGRGHQTRLLAAAHALHGSGGTIWARCRFQSQSHRNLGRAGLATLCTTTFWGKDG